MKNEIQSLITRIETTHAGEPWFGKSVLTILEEADAKKAAVRKGGSSHSMLDVLYHINTWGSFTLNRIKKDKINDLAAAEALDWRTIIPGTHTWKKALAEYKSLIKEIITELKKKDDEFLLEIVDYRKYNFRYLIHGMIDHTIYHAGQIALLNKLPDL